MEISLQASGQSAFRRAFMLFLVGLVALLVIVGTTAWLFSRTNAYSKAIVTTREIRASVVDMKSLLQDAEIGQRGFLITGKPSYLEPFERAQAEIPGRLVELQRRAGEMPDIVVPAADLAAQVTAKMEELSTTIALLRSGQRAEALAIVDSDVGKALMDEARSLFAQITDLMDRRFVTDVGRQQQSATILQIVASIGAITILLVAGGAGWIATRYAREIDAAHSQIAVLNQGLEEKVLARTQDLARANEEVQRFAYIVTHDLRAPLVNIMGFTAELESSIAPLQDLVASVEAEGREVPEARLSATEDVPEAISFIRSSTRKMDGLINAILKLSRDGRRELAPVQIDLGTMFETSAEVIRHQLVEAGGEVEIDAAVKTIISDRIALEQIIGNLLDNAVKYAAPDRPLRIAIRSKGAGSELIDIDVQDNGRGIAEQDNERVFELFRRSGTQDKPGEGLGLAHVRSSVRSMGGDITLTSRLGEGTTFRIRLPRDLRRVLRSKAA